MKKLFRICVVVVLLTALLLTGCNIMGGVVSYEQMKYTHPNMSEFEQTLEKSISSALTEKKIKKLETAILDFYEAYDSFFTNLNLAFINYSRDLTDVYWEEEYRFCAQQSATADAALDSLYRALAKSPLRETLEGDNYFGEDFFKSYEGESLYDEKMMSLLEQEALLQSQYQTISGQATDVTYYSDLYFEQYGTQMAQVFCDLVQVRQEMATYAGYDSYVQFAYDFYHLRDYKPEQAIGYLADVRAELVPLYTQLNSSDFWSSLELEYCTEEDMLSYVRSVSESMGGTIKKAFAQMEKADLYDITYSENKYNTSFEIYLGTYAVPYVFVCPTGSEYDKLTFAHEFGHFCCDYANYGGASQGVDVAEIFSQSMEYLSLSYSNDAGQLEKLKMADSLCVYVEQAAYASFEHQVYGLTGDELNVENIQALYEQVLADYGMNVDGRDGRDYVCVTHFYESPLYVISYVLSNDAALHVYELERTEKGKGVACFEENMTLSQPYLLAFLEQAQLESPFADGRLARVRQTFESILT